MKTNIFKNSLLVVFALTAGVLTGCSNNEGEVAPEVVPSDGNGCIALNVRPAATFTRALNENLYRNVSDYTVVITNSKNEEVENTKFSLLSQYIEVPFGTYKVRAYYGAESAASRDNFLVEGSETVVLASAEVKSVSVKCAPTCGKAMVNFGAEMDTYFDNYYVTYSTPKLGSDEVTWAKGDADPWYLAVSENGDNVKATIHLVPKAEYDMNKTNTTGSTSEGTVVREYLLKRDKSWTLNINPNYDTSYGTLGVTITIDESTNDTEIPIEIPSEWI